MKKILKQADARMTLFTGSSRVGEHLVKALRGKVKLEDGGYDWEKLERELPLGSTMLTLQTAWEWLGRIDQGLVLVFVPLMIYLLVKVKRLESAMNRQAASVNVAVTAPTVVPAPPANGFPGMHMEQLNPYRGVYA